MAEPLCVGITRDFLTEGAGLLDDVLLEMFGSVQGVVYEHIPRGGRVAEPDQIRSYDAIIALHLHFAPQSFEGIDRLAIIARWGVGYDMIDVPACTEHDIALCITPDAVRRPVAEGVIGMMLALSKHLLIKDRLTRTGRWHEKTAYVGKGLENRVMGCIGMGNIGAEVIRLLKPFDVARLLVCDPYVSAEQAADIGAELVDLDTLLKEADFVSINCPLTEETHHLLSEREFSLMKPTAYLINTARGPIVDQVALTKALQAAQIAGAALDVFEKEPIEPDDPLIEMENVILTPHGIAWTEELSRGNGVGACQNVLTVLRGDEPRHVVNKEVVNRPGFQAKLGRLRQRWQALN